MSGSQTPEMKAEILSADVDDRRVTKQAAGFGREGTRKAMWVSTRIGTEAKFSSVDEEVSRNRESKGTEETILVEDGQNYGMEGQWRCPPKVKQEQTEMKAELLSADVDDRGVTQDAAAARRDLAGDVHQR